MTPIAPFGIRLTCITQAALHRTRLVRWQLLAELATGEPLRVAQFAKAVGLSPDTTSKHLITLRTAGIAEFAENRLYCLHDRFMPDPDKWEIDFGHCVVRLPQPKVGKRKSR